MKTLKHITPKLKACSSTDELRDIFSTAIQELGYGGFDAYSMRSDTIHNADQDCNLFICDYGFDLINTYLKDGWLQMDPVVAEVARTTTPFEYVEFLRNTSKNTSVLWQLAMIKFNKVNRAWCMPLSTVGYMRGMTVYSKQTGDNAQEKFTETRDELHLMCIQFMEVFIKFYNTPPSKQAYWDNRTIDVTTIGPRETDCLHWAAQGKTNWEIGQILKISENTVRYHLKKVFVKLGANSRSSAVSIALHNGVI